MTVVAESSARRSRNVPPVGPVRLALAGLLAALRVSVIGLVACIGVGVLLTVSGGARPSVAGAVGIGGDLWLAGHHVPLALPDGMFSALPLGLVAFPLALLARAGRRLAREVTVRGLRQAAVAVAALSVPYGLAGLLVGVSTLTQEVHATVLPSALATFLAAVLAGAIGVLRGAGLGVHVAARVPARCRPVLVAAAGAVAALVLVGAVLVAGMLAVRVIAVRDITATLSATGLGGVLLFLLGAVYVPNAIVFAVGYAAGPGFSLGAGTLIAPWAYHGGPVPALPLLAAVPRGHPPEAAWLVLLGPALAGVVAGMLLIRHTLPRSLPRAALTGAATGPVVGLMAGLLALLAGGSAGGARLVELGPDPLRIGLAVAAEIAVTGAIAAVLACWLARRKPARDADAG